MRPAALKTKIFLDSGDPLETAAILQVLGFLDGQTTNPTLIARNPVAAERLRNGKKFSRDEIMRFYRDVVTEISGLIPHGSVSIETYADKETSAKEMLMQGEDMFSWISNAYIKYPIISAGLEAAKRSVEQGMRVNMTLCFSEAQAAAVYAATEGAKRGGVFVSPFIGRLDDIGENGIDLIKNIVRLYGQGDGHVEVLAASARSVEHLLASLAFGADIITAPYHVLEAWGDMGMEIPSPDYPYKPPKELKPINYTDYDLKKSLHEFDITHELTDKGIEKFSKDWNSIIC